MVTLKRSKVYMDKLYLNGKGLFHGLLGPENGTQVAAACLNKPISIQFISYSANEMEVQD